MMTFRNAVLPAGNTTHVLALPRAVEGN